MIIMKLFTILENCVKLCRYYLTPHIIYSPELDRKKGREHEKEGGRKRKKNDERILIIKHMFW